MESEEVSEELAIKSTGHRQHLEHNSPYSAAGVGNVFFQARLTVGSANDPLEHEADAVADRVMRMPEQSFVQRKCASCEEEDKVQRKSSTSFIQKTGIQGGTVASDAVSNKINASKGGGSGMDSHTQSFMQNRFGADFSDVKIHTGGDAIQMNRDLNAKAFTVGNDIYFNEGRYSPNSDSGKHLLAHELTHTVQQGGSVDLPIQRAIGDGHDLSSPRFHNDAVLEEIYDGNSQLAMGSTGDAVTKIQHALQDLGVFLRNFGIDGIFENETRRGVSAYQRRKHINGDASGVVATETITSLDNEFAAVTDSAATLSQNPADMACLLELLCPWNRALVTDFRDANFRVILVDRLFWADEMLDGALWQPNPMEGAGETDSGVIRIKAADTCEVVAKTLYHEYQHARSPRRLRRQPWADEETNAYTLETNWSIARGLSPDPGLVTTDPGTGATTVDPAAVTAQVGTYPGMVVGSTDEVIAKVGATRVRVRRSDGSVVVRAAIAGDTVPGPRQVTNPQSVRAREWVCV